MRGEFLPIRLGICRYIFIVAMVLFMAIIWTFAQAETASSSGNSPGSAAESVQQDSQEPPDRNCPRCGEKVTPGEVCKNCGRVFRGSTGGADPTTGIQNRVKSDISNIKRTKSNINQSLRNTNNNLRNMQQNIFRIRDINRRLYGNTRIR